METIAAELPYIDEHRLEIAAPAPLVWAALLRTVEATVSGGATPTFTRLLGCEDTVPGGPRPLETGSVLPGFHVAGALEPSQLALAGRHRFSRYALIFHLDDLGARTVLRAETRAEFPGLKGRVYKTLVIGTRMHVLVTRRILTATQRRAER